MADSPEEPGHDPLVRLAALLGRLPGIGEKSALRLALALVRSDGEYVQALAETIDSVCSFGETIDETVRLAGCQLRDGGSLDRNVRRGRTKGRHDEQQAALA